jgi:hypothetical protein
MIRGQMYCRKCGTQNDDNAYKCVSCGDLLQVAPVDRSRKVDNHLVLAIVVSVLCCLPFGIAGVFHAAQVNPKAQFGDIDGAEESARKARNWSLWGLGVGLVMYGLYALLFLGGLLTETMTY